MPLVLRTGRAGGMLAMPSKFTKILGHSYDNRGRHLRARTTGFDKAEPQASNIVVSCFPFAISVDGWLDDLRLPDIKPQSVYRRASSLETRPAQFLSVVVTDGLGAAAVNCPNGDDVFSSSSRKECTFASIAALTLSEPRSLKSLC